MSLRDEFYEGIWSTQTGEKIFISDLTDSHLISIIRYLESTGNHPLVNEWLPVLRKERDDRQAKVSDMFDALVD